MDDKNYLLAALCLLPAAQLEIFDGRQEDLGSAPINIYAHKLG